MKQDFLFELGCEELPAGDLAPMAEHLKLSMQKSLEAAKFQFGALRTYYTPRRLALLIEDLQVEKAAETLERRGPAKVAGFDANGHPTKALEGFLKSCNASLGDVFEVETDKGVWLAVKLTQAAQNVKAVLPTIVAEAVKSMPMKKAMRWGSHDFAFLRPVHWIVALLGAEVVPVKLFDLVAGDVSFGHRFHHPGAVTIKQPKDYLNALRKAHVMADPEERREVIMTETNALVSGEFSAHFGKLNEVINLVEWPVALLCHFEKEFLTVPKEVLIATMEANQRVFPIHNNQQELQNSFVVISNIVSQDPAEVIQGNEKVVRARLSDAKFFYDEDLKVPLENHLEALKKITFQQGLGSLFDKTKRVEKISNMILSHLYLNDDGVKYKVNEAAKLCKADLPTNMVQEFPELQGYMGCQYFLKQSDKPMDQRVIEVAEAIEDHYKPKGRGGELPRSFIGAIVALADKFDTLVGLFSIGKKPSSSGDPFGLRRQVIGIIEIIIKFELKFPVNRLLSESIIPYYKEKGLLSDDRVLYHDLLTFILERLSNFAQEQYLDISTKVIQAVCGTLMTGVTSIVHELVLYNFPERIKVLNALLQSPEGQRLLELYKRIDNILKGVDVSGLHRDSNGYLLINENLFEHDAEKELYRIHFSRELHPVGNFSFQDSCLRLLYLEKPIADFFAKENNIMVMHENAFIRNNRLALLHVIRQDFIDVAHADFSKL